MAVGLAVVMAMEQEWEVLVVAVPAEEPVAEKETVSDPVERGRCRQ